MVVGGGMPRSRADAAGWTSLASETLELAAPPRQGLTVSGSSGQTLTGLGPVQEALVSFGAQVGEKLGRQRLMAGQVLVFVTTNRFSVGWPFDANSATVKRPYPTDLAPHHDHRQQSDARGDHPESGDRPSSWPQGSPGHTTATQQVKSRGQVDPRGHDPSTLASGARPWPYHGVAHAPRPEEPANLGHGRAHQNAHENMANHRDRGTPVLVSEGARRARPHILIPRRRPDMLQWFGGFA
jgi:hypothetical protein